VNVNAEPTDFRLAELERRLDNLLRLGTVAAADYSGARVRVQSGELLTGWIPWLTRRAADDIDWWAPEVGEQVLLLSPCGDPAQAVCLPAIYQAARPAPETSPTVRTIRFADGMRISYDRRQSLLAVDCPGTANVSLSGDAVVQVGGAATVSAAGAVAVSSGTRLTLTAPAVNVAAAGGATKGTMTGSFALTGDLSVTGNITATGSVIDAGGNTNHHSH
jgi:phage baseplate assembly protein V